MARQRTMGKRDLPNNLYSSKDSRTGTVYFQYKDIRTGKFVGFGTSKSAAIADAIALNAEISKQMASIRLEAMIEQPQQKRATNGLTLSQFNTAYLEIQKARVKDGEITDNTLRSRKCSLNAAISLKGDISLRDFTTKDAVDILKHYTAQGKHRMAQSIRSGLIDFFIEAISLGECENNPAAVAKNPKAKVKRQRLLIEEYNVIYATALKMVSENKLASWVPNALQLSLITAQRPSDVVRFMFTDVKDELLHVIPKKNQGKVRLQIPTALRLDSINVSLAQAIAQCRDGVLARNMIHHAKNYTTVRRGGAVHEQTLSKKFTQVLIASGLTWDEKIGTPPTLYELRSLAKREYMKQGVDTKTLLGHSTQRMEDLYADDRGREWKTLVL